MSLKIVCSVGDIKVYVEDEDQSYTPEVVATIVRQSCDGVLQMYRNTDRAEDGADPTVHVTTDDEDE